MNRIVLDNWISRTRGQIETAGKLTRGLSSQQVHWHPAQGSWSIAQCLHHLAVSVRAYAPRIHRALQDPVMAQADGKAYAPRWLAGRFIEFVSPRSPKALKAPGTFKPESDPPTDGLQDFIEMQEFLIHALGAALPVDLNRNKLRSPALPLMTFTIGECFEMLIEHNDRHLGQAQRVRDHADFPAGAAAR
ncbi:MAG: DinB family protein [Planctomycetota bacterium]